MDISQIEKALAAIIAVGALGTAAFGVIEAFGKALAWRGWGLPYAGYSRIRMLAAEYAAALRLTYGEHYGDILIQQYRDGRAKGQAPDTLRQGVRLALPLMEQTEAAALIGRAWGLGDEMSTALAHALAAEQAGAITPDESETAAVLAGRFALAVDARIAAAFSLAEERYQAIARFAAGVAAVGLSLAFNYAAKGGIDGAAGYPWMIALIIGLAAVPLAPIAKDLSSALSDSLRAWRQVAGVKV
ncbi:MAG: hypothetical protein Q8M88_08800 [Phenylobacterium sp.]|uniref:hypothetical protein n=1 Tax=Phenylobacterium sp. TaxID=1871053 RepID=UPI0027345FBF|nr:hypothetical protein [Phenylobacterium sp.]MDP3174516.1 hypothetical protein [Phenylobacterium sp.]